MNILALLALLAWINVCSAHHAAFAPGMYCQGGLDPNNYDHNTNIAVSPVYQLSKQDWWFHHDRGCDMVPPAPGVFLELPAGGSFTVEIANNQAFTTLSHDGRLVSPWTDGGEHPENWSGPGNPPDCIQENGALHTNNQSMAAGTAFAISYNSDLNAVTLENLVVFTVLPNTPWKRIATYAVPADLPSCPAEGCTCAWLWIPKGCGEPNMYMQPFKCKVTGSTSNRRLATAQPPRFCKYNFNDCVRGAKQMMVYEQAEGNTVTKPENEFVSYSTDWGFSPGAQYDIFQ